MPHDQHFKGVLITAAGVLCLTTDSLLLLESVLGPCLVWLVLGEDTGATGLIGGIIVISALAVSNIMKLRRAYGIPW